MLQWNDGDEEKYYAGGSYWPEHKPLKDLLYMKETWPPRDFAAVVQQNPIPDEGAIFKSKKFKHWLFAEPPEVTNVLVSIDTAFSEKETRDSAYSAYAIWGIFPQKEVDYSGRERMMGNMILLGSAKGHWSFPELCGICQGLHDEYRASLDFFLVEDKASGQSLIQELRARGLPTLSWQPEKDKITRAWAAAPTIESGRVYVNPNMHFTQEFLADVTTFPHGDGADMTDTFTMAVLWMVHNWHVIPEDFQVYNDMAEEDKPSFRRSNSNTYWGSVATH